MDGEGVGATVGATAGLVDADGWKGLWAPSVALVAMEKVYPPSGDELGLEQGTQEQQRSHQWEPQDEG